jgi:hypothetical protein
MIGRHEASRKRLTRYYQRVQVRREMEKITRATHNKIYLREPALKDIHENPTGKNIPQ